MSVPPPATAPATLVALDEAPPPALAAALGRFEERFRYPLGPGASFRIDHGTDYTRFFRAIGEAGCFAVAREGRVLGTIGAAARRVLLPDGRSVGALYVGDLKVGPSPARGRTLLRLARAVAAWAGSRGATAAFSVVMDGTDATPDAYTGRLGLPRFDPLGSVVVLHTTTRAASGGGGRAADDGGEACHARLARGRCALPVGRPALRSEDRPRWLVTSDRRACGLLEDTRRAKRLYAADGAELPGAHLSAFAYADGHAAAALLRLARAEAARRGTPALFAAVPAGDAPVLARALERDGEHVLAAPATVYGTGLPAGATWHVNTAEI